MMSLVLAPIGIIPCIDSYIELYTSKVYMCERLAYKLYLLISTLPCRPLHKLVMLFIIAKLLTYPIRTSFCMVMPIPHGIWKGYYMLLTLYDALLTPLPILPIRKKYLIYKHPLYLTEQQTIRSDKGSHQCIMQLMQTS